MKRRYILYQRGRTFYCEDTLNRKQMSLRTKDREVALRLLHSKNEAEQQPAINFQIERAIWLPAIRKPKSAKRDS